MLLNSCSCSFPARLHPYHMADLHGDNACSHACCVLSCGGESASLNVTVSTNWRDKRGRCHSFSLLLSPTWEYVLKQVPLLLPCPYSLSSKPPPFLSSGEWDVLGPAPGWRNMGSLWWFLLRSWRLSGGPGPSFLPESSSGGDGIRSGQ